MARKASKTSSKKTAQLAAKVMVGYWPSKAETKSLAASVLAQAEREAKAQKPSTRRAKRPK